MTTEEHAVVDQAIDALANVENLYQRNGKLVRLRWEETPPLSTLPAHPHVEQVAAPAVRDLLTQCARFIAMDEAGKESARHVPIWLVQQIMARDAWPGIRPLTGLLHEPCLRRDGTVVDTPGYDGMTGLLYVPTREAIKVDPRPTRDDALFAIENLCEIVCDMPFADEANKAAWLAALLTPFTRFAFNEAVPLFLIDANIAGVGKSTLADVIGVIATGQRMARSVYTDSDDEMRKLITSVALSGTRVMLLDNVSGELGCAPLDAALTGTVWTDRVLGKSAITAPLTLSAVWYATGNNITLKGDAHRRTLEIRLRSELERPEERQAFRHPNLLRWVESKRESFVRDALTILVAYQVAGRPGVAMEPWGSYEAWSQYVRASLIWCGLPDPAQTRRLLVCSRNQEHELLSKALRAIAQLDTYQVGLTASEIVERLKAPTRQDERAVLVQWTGRADEHGFPLTRSLGNKLSKVRDRVVDGLRVTVIDERWLVQCVGPEGSGGSTGSRSGRSPSSPDPGGAPKQPIGREQEAGA